MRQLPPLNAIKGFEAVVRLGNHKDAAAELGVTHGAISRQVKVLEDYFGAKLFQQRGRNLVPTELARYYAAELGAVLDRVSQATQRVREPAIARKVRITGTSSLLMHWLVPRLPGFQAAHPSVEVTISANRAPYAKVAATNDIVLRRHPMRRDGFECRPLFRDRRVLVGTPELFRRCRVEQPSDVLDHTLLVTDGRTEAGVWDRWITANGLTPTPHANRIKFDHVFVQIEAAVNGLGFALLSEVLMEQYLESGELISPFPDTAMAYPNLYALVPEDARSSPGIRCFVRWIAEEGRKVSGPMEGADDDTLRPVDFDLMADSPFQSFALG
ncbi:LysR substrate-binding domain-containing protein [Oceanicola sp. 22II-s10i]|uniref:LysR substrate-binding domain-containing protein n=1 Tax=Oceanicola sp. 22II-s10i TaxID=1317116 RepID=UPI0015954C2A|nr:LysR substrate-binding domain-containing protein [Oceanicola sp. 22II-s10i]